jgi:hypothetical protein
MHALLASILILLLGSLVQPAAAVVLAPCDAASDTCPSKVSKESPFLGAACVARASCQPAHA